MAAKAKKIKASSNECPELIAFHPDESGHGLTEVMHFLYQASANSLIDETKARYLHGKDGSVTASPARVLLASIKELRGKSPELAELWQSLKKLEIVKDIVDDVPRLELHWSSSTSSLTSQEVLEPKKCLLPMADYNDLPDKLHKALKMDIGRAFRQKKWVENCNSHLSKYAAAFHIDKLDFETVKDAYIEAQVAVESAKVGSPSRRTIAKQYTDVTAADYWDRMEKVFDDDHLSVLAGDLTLKFFDIKVDSAAGAPWTAKEVQKEELKLFRSFENQVVSFNHVLTRWVHLIFPDQCKGATQISSGVALLKHIWHNLGFTIEGTLTRQLLDLLIYPQRFVIVSDWINYYRRARATLNQGRSVRISSDHLLYLLMVNRINVDDPNGLGREIQNAVKDAHHDPFQDHTIEEAIELIEARLSNRADALEKYNKFIQKKAEPHKRKNPTEFALAAFQADGHLKIGGQGSQSGPNKKRRKDKKKQKRTFKTLRVGNNVFQVKQFNSCKTCGTPGHFERDCSTLSDNQKESMRHLQERWYEENPDQDRRSSSEKMKAHLASVGDRIASQVSKSYAAAAAAATSTPSSKATAHESGGEDRDELLGNLADIQRKLLKHNVSVMTAGIDSP